MKKLLILTLLILPYSSVLASAIEDLNPVSHWKCDETSGVRYDSNTINSNDLTDVNTVMSATGKLNNACDFEKTNSEYLSITDASQSALDLSTTASFSFWVNFETLPASGVYTFLSKITTAGNESFSLFLNYSTPLQLFLQGSADGTYGDAGTAYYTNWTPSTGTWYHMVFTFDGATDKTAWYINGTSHASSTSGYTVGSFFDGTSPFTIGADVGWNNGYFDGLIDEITVFNTVLTPSEVTTLYNSGTPLDYDPPAPPTSTTTATSTTTNMDDTNFLLAVIIFFCTFMFLGIAFSTIRKK